MKSEERTRRQKSDKSQPTSLRWSGLRFRMTVSYALTGVVTMLLLELLAGAAVLLVMANNPITDTDALIGARLAARMYALAAAVRSSDAGLDPRITFEPGRPFSIAIDAEDFSNDAKNLRYIGTRLPDKQQVPFALLIAPDGRVLASSYPSRYPAMTSAAQLLPQQSHLVTNALTGAGGSGTEMLPQGRIGYAIEPVLNKEKQLIGAVYVQVPGITVGNFLRGFGSGLVASGLFWLLLMLLVGGFFGAITTRGLVRRLRQLVDAVTHFADGDYTQRVQISHRDEVGRLEEQFNRMAQQLVESIAQRQALAEQNARLAERGRLARDLHDSIKQQVFAVSMQLGAAKALLDQKREAALRHLEEADNLSYRVQRELTALIQELRPLALQDKDLADALRDYVTTWGYQHNIAAAIQISDGCVLPESIEEALWRVAQEALSNIARHSRASEVEVSLECEQGKVLLSIADNGQGFDTNAANGSGVGLHSMQERMEALGGTLTVESKMGEGTRIVARCPYSQVRAGDLKGVLT